MTVNELKKELKGQYAEAECYKFTGSKKIIHNDYIISIDETGSETVEEWHLMGEEEYSKTILANTCVEADFSEWYNSEDAKILVIMVSSKIKIFRLFTGESEAKENNKECFIDNIATSNGKETFFTGEEDAKKAYNHAAGQVQKARKYKYVITTYQFDFVTLESTETIQEEGESLADAFYSANNWNFESITVSEEV